MASSAPPDPDDIGRAGWLILHTTAAAFPNYPTAAQREAMRAFITSWSQVYPCSICAYHMRQEVKAHPPVVDTKEGVSVYVCKLHNSVNKMLGKPEYSCDADEVLRRWHPTYPEMADQPSIEEQLAAEQRRAAASRTVGAAGAGTMAHGWSAKSQSGPANAVSDTTDITMVLAKLKTCQAFCPQRKEPVV